MLFADLNLSAPILKAVVHEGYTTATPIQAQAIPHVLAGKDVLASAQTGTGKTAAFAMPILHRLSSKHAPVTGSRRPRCLVLAPTRELAAQISDSFQTYGRGLDLRHAIVYGGVNQNPQVRDLRRGVDIIVATPGRLMDLMNQGHVDLRAIETFVLDEADRMLDMGFIHDIRKIAASISPTRQTLLFSATMPLEIKRLAQTLLRDPVTIQIAPVATNAETIEQTVYFVEKGNKPELLAHLVGTLPMSRAIVFTRTKHGADRVVRHLHHRGIRAEAIHGNKSQNARERALANFAANKVPVLVATDIASRGIDVDGITHVVNYDLTHEPETYVHRIGRTGRAGAAGAAVAFCGRDEMQNLKGIERLLKRSIAVKPTPTLAAMPHDDSERHPRVHESHRSDSRSSGSHRSDSRANGSERSDSHRSGLHRSSGSSDSRNSDSARGASHRSDTARPHTPRNASNPHRYDREAGTAHRNASPTTRAASPQPSVAHSPARAPHPQHKPAHVISHASKPVSGNRAPASRTLAAKSSHPLHASGRTGRPTGASRSAGRR